MEAPAIADQGDERLIADVEFFYQVSEELARRMVATIPIDAEGRATMRANVMNGIVANPEAREYMLSKLNPIDVKSNREIVEEYFGVRAGKANSILQKVDDVTVKDWRRQLMDGRTATPDEMHAHLAKPLVKRGPGPKYLEVIRAISTYYGVNWSAAQEMKKRLTDSDIESLVVEVREGKKYDGPPQCPQCDSVMIKRESVHGFFWGCSRYPECRGTIAIKEENKPVTMEKTGVAVKQLTTALTYIKDIGGTEEARRWLNLALKSLGE